MIEFEAERAVGATAEKRIAIAVIKFAPLRQQKFLGEAQATPAELGRIVHIYQVSAVFFPARKGAGKVEKVQRPGGEKARPNREPGSTQKWVSPAFESGSASRHD